MDVEMRSVSLPPKVIVKAATFLNPEVILSAYTFSWVDHTQLKKGNDLAKNLINIMNSVALVSALSLTIWVGIIFQEYSGRADLHGDPVESWKVNTLIVILWVGCVVQALSMINAVLVSMLIEACATPLEVGEFICRVPSATRVPILQLYVAILTGTLGMIFYFYTFYGLRMFFVTASIALAVSGVLNAVYYQRNVAALKATRETTAVNASRALDKAQIEAMLATYVSSVGFENIDKEHFLEFIARAENGQFELAFVTKRRATLIFERFLENRILSE